MSVEDFSTFRAARARIVAEDGWSTETFMSDPGEALLMEGALQKHEWTAASPTQVHRRRGATELWWGRSS